MLRDLEAFWRYVTLIAVRFYLLTYLLTYIDQWYHTIIFQVGLFYFNLISGVFTIGSLAFGHLGRGPFWFLASVILNLNYLLQVEHLMYRLKYPIGLVIYNYHLLLFIVIVGLCYIASRCEMEEIYSA